MIESIHISGVATYAAEPEVLNELSKFNFVYGSNGSGKTTVSRVIANEINHPTCRVTWRRGTKLIAMVYNRDFVAKNFGPTTEIKGIFTLGEKNADTLAKIATAKAELDGLTKSIEGFEETLKGPDGISGKRGDLAALEDQLKDKCWSQKKKHDFKLSSAFEGFRNSSETVPRISKRRCCKSKPRIRRLLCPSPISKTRPRRFLALLRPSSRSLQRSPWRSSSATSQTQSSRSACWGRRMSISPQ